MTFCFYSFTQSSINADGNVFTGNEGSISYSLGQFAYGYFSVDDYSLLEGVQQAFEITVSEIETMNGSPLCNITAYPNPAKGLISIEISEQNQLPLKFLLMDETGTKLVSGDVCKNHMEIDLSHYPPGILFLSIEKNFQSLKIFKLVKLNH